MKDIGQRLRSAREALGITLEQAEDETKIRRKYLEALEAANEADIPGEVYLKGFLRTYGNYVGLDGTELVETYKNANGKREQQHGAASEERAAERGAAAFSVARGATLEQGGDPPTQTRPAVQPRPARERPRRPRDRSAGLNRRSGASPGARLLLIAVVLLAAVAYVGWLIFRQVGPASGPPPTPPPPVQQNKPPEPAPNPAPKPPEPAPAPPAPKVTMTRGTGEDVIFSVAAKEIQVQLEPGTKPVWLQAEVDGKPDFSGTTTKPLALKGTKIRIRAGHMDGISVTVNGQRFDKPLDAVTYNLIFNLAAEAP